MEVKPHLDLLAVPKMMVHRLIMQAPQIYSAVLKAQFYREKMKNLKEESENSKKNVFNSLTISKRCRREVVLINLPIERIRTYETVLNNFACKSLNSFSL